ncbi:DUF4366 domain-containing protein [Niallia circulans]
MKGKLIKRTMIASLLVSSLAIAPISSVYAKENEKPKEEQTDKKQETNKNEEAKKSENQSIPEPPSGENVVGKEEEVEVDIDTPASVTGERMEGNGTVVDFTTSGSKAFYTIVDDDQQVFYLIIDMDKTENNVYFLSEINRGELGGQKTDENNVAPTPPNNVKEPEKEIKSEETENNNLGFLLIVLIIGGIGAVAYYFLVIKKKQNKNNKEDDMAEDEMPEDYEDDFEEDYLDDNESENKEK